MDERGTFDADVEREPGRSLASVVGICGSNSCREAPKSPSRPMARRPMAHERILCLPTPVESGGLGWTGDEREMQRATYLRKSNDQAAHTLRRIKDREGDARQMYAGPQPQKCKHGEGKKEEREGGASIRGEANHSPAAVPFCMAGLRSHVDEWFWDASLRLGQQAGSVLLHPVLVPLGPRFGSS